VEKETGNWNAKRVTLDLSAVTQIAVDVFSANEGAINEGVRCTLSLSLRLSAAALK